MTRNLYLANRLREVFLSGHWIANTNYKEQLQSIDWRQATQKTEGLNTIAALTFHINYYLVGLIKVLNAGTLDISDKYSFDAPEILSATDWKNSVDEFLQNAETFASKVEQLPDEQFDKPFVKEKYGTYLRNVEAVIEHSYYHLGQIALIKKLIFAK
ncbi:MAG: hypothetical protein RJA07_123 [Bacteroidota bacterium]|jgi:uncharacterized damage-inducible protein DinB